MQNIINSVYRQDYIAGFAQGLNPFLQLDKSLDIDHAFSLGFRCGRLDYETMNGRTVQGIPELIVTNQILEDFLMAGMLGMNIEAEGYNSFQLKIIQQWYESGIEKYEPNESIYLLALLEKNGILTN